MDTRQTRQQQIIEQQETAREEGAAAPAAQDGVATPAARGKRWQGLLRRHAPFLLIVLLAAGLLTINVNQAWVSIHEDNGLAFSAIAINHLRFGLGVTKGQSLADSEAFFSTAPNTGAKAIPPDQFFPYLLTGPVNTFFYPDHPPLLGLTIAGAFLVFGEDFWVVRLVPIVYSLATLIVFYLLMRSLFDLGVARFASFLYATFPMMAYYGRDVAHEAPTLFWTMLLLTGYMHWQRDHRRRWLFLMGAAVFIGEAYGWPLFYFACILFAVDWLAARRVDWRLALATVCPALIMLGLLFAQIAWALGGTLQPVIDKFFYRTGDALPDGSPITLASWLSHIGQGNLQGYGFLSPLLLLLALVFVARRIRAEGWSLRIRWLGITLLFGLSHVLLFRNGAYFHAYWQFYLLPFYAACLGWAIVAFARSRISAARWAWGQAAALAGVGVLLFVLNLPIIVGLYSSISGIFVLPFGL
ncbi:MAG TPA: glycosyltransferase family 39 protein [Ktedonobacterales bacterium]|jgi:4-amino-4-deoxy-L-arabinose transferase-like glycosyltransferase